VAALVQVVVVRPPLVVPAVAVAVEVEEAEAAAAAMAR